MSDQLASTKPTVEELAAEARIWLDANAERKGSIDGENPGIVWGEGTFSVSVFHALSYDEEKAVLDRLRAWHQRKSTRGYHAITARPEIGGLGLSREHAAAFARLEAEYVIPARHETFSVTTGLISPTVDLFGTPEQKDRFVGPLLAAEILCCQLFSEPGAGSDLANLSCRAERDGDEWIVNGQKTWSSGAQFSQWGELITRTDPDVVKHKGLTAFLVPMDAPGVEIRQIKQMSGGTSFNEVFFTDVRIPDSLRLGAVGDGWNVALTTLSFERDKVGSATARAGAALPHVLALAQHLGATGDPVMRQRLMQVYISARLQAFLLKRTGDLRQAGAKPGPEGSIGKLLWTEGLRLISDVASELLGPRLLADTGEWGTFEWVEHITGAPGYRIAGGAVEVQRNIMGERVLGLPPEPRVDKDKAWKDVPR
jgi:alkylation response protein AidB-like acyl-CoA dehydrogenase